MKMLDNHLLDTCTHLIRAEICLSVMLDRTERFIIRSLYRIITVLGYMVAGYLGIMVVFPPVRICMEV